MSDVQVIVVDNDPNGSEDNRLTCESHSNVIYVHEKISGRSAAINAGIKHSKGTYIAFTDDDTVVSDSVWLHRLQHNFENRPDVGYVSGNVVAYELETSAQRMWEAKGGLSKGKQRKEFEAKFFTRPRLSGVPIRLIAAGANSMIPKRILDEIGSYDSMLGIGSRVCHGESLDICYRTMRAGYTAIYDPEARIFHFHPRSVADLRRKMFQYGIGDTAVHTKFLLEYKDIRGLFEILWGRPLTLLLRLLKSLVRVYPMTPDMLIAGFTGALLGPCIYLRARRLGLTQ